jgi:hypothetical protein
MKDSEPLLEAAAIDVPAMLAIHRKADSYVTLHRKPTPRIGKMGRPITFEDVGSLPVRELENFLPGLGAELFKDSYFSVNGFYQPWQAKSPLIDFLCRVNRRERYLRYLNCCYCDLDVGRTDEAHPKNLPAIKAKLRLSFMMDVGELPQASIIGFSGRGLYLLWLLHEENEPGEPVRAWDERLAIYKKINQAINLKLLKLAADTRAYDGARVLRIPGTVNTKSQKKVAFMVQHDAATGAPISYTLKELASFFRVPYVLQNELTFRKTVRRGSAPNRRNGRTVLNAKRIADLLALESWRGGFKKRGLKYAQGDVSTGRHTVLNVFACCLHAADYSRKKAIEAVTAMAANCTPAYPSDPTDTPLAKLVQDVFTNKNNKRLWNNSTLCGLLGITPAVALELELQTILPEPRAKEGQRPRGHEKEKRREFISRYFHEHGPKTCREMVKICLDYDFEASVQTIATDFKAIGLKARSKGGRPKKTDAQHSLFPAPVQPSPSPDEQTKLMEAQQRLKQKRAALGLPS